MSQNTNHFWTGVILNSEWMTQPSRNAINVIRIEAYYLVGIVLYMYIKIKPVSII